MKRTSVPLLAGSMLVVVVVLGGLLWLTLAHADWTSSRTSSALVNAWSATGDMDGDGVPDSSDNCPAWPNPGQGWPPWAVPLSDWDCDGFPSSTYADGRGAEADIGTDPGDACADTSNPNDEADDAWPPDWDDSQTVNLLDLLVFKPHFRATDPSDPRYDARFDLNTDGAINLLDLLPFKPFFRLSCT